MSVRSIQSHQEEMMRDFKFKTPICAQTALILLMGVALAACSPAEKYQSTNRTTDTLGTDVPSCQAKASDLMGRELLLDQSYERTEGDALETSFVWFDARKQRQRFYENCMAQRGSKPVSTSSKK